MSTEYPRRYKARYASSMAGEIHKNVRLDSGEKIVYSKFVRERKNWFLAQPRVLAVTPLRIMLLEHSLFAADWILEIPRHAITQVSLENGLTNGWVNFTYFSAGVTRTVRIQPMRRHISPEENRELFDVLNAFHRGGLVSPSERLGPARTGPARPPARFSNCHPESKK